MYNRISGAAVFRTACYVKGYEHWPDGLALLWASTVFIHQRFYRIDELKH